MPVAGDERAAVVRPEPSALPLVLEPPGAEVMPPHVTSELPPSAVPTLSPEAWGTYAPPVEALQSAVEARDSATAQPVAGLPYFDDAGQPHGAVQSPVAPATESSESQLHAATVLERVAARIRAGRLAVDGVDAAAGDPAALAAVLASLLRHQR